MCFFQKLWAVNLNQNYTLNPKIILPVEKSNRRYRITLLLKSLKHRFLSTSNRVPTNKEIWRKNKKNVTKKVYDKKLILVIIKFCKKTWFWRKNEKKLTIEYFDKKNRNMKYFDGKKLLLRKDIWKWVRQIPSPIVNFLVF